MITIPCRPDLPHYDMQVVLDGTTYTLEFRWNEREAAWRMSIADESDDPIATGLKVVLRFPLGLRCSDARMPPGRIMAIDTGNKDEPPGVDDLGDRVQLVYYTGADILAITDADTVL